jgi:hypothetical protein
VTVLPGPLSVSVRVTSTSTWSSVILRATPGRGASAREPIQPSVNRTRHLQTVSRDTPVRDATRVSGATPSSSAQARTIRARSASEFGTTRRDLLAMADRLRCRQVERAGIEATSDYWKPVYFLLEQEGLDCEFYQASHVKALPGGRRPTSWTPPGWR